MNIKLSKQLQQAAYGDIKTPLTITLADNIHSQLNCCQIIRFLPGKRLVAFATWQGKEVVAKIFFAANKAAYHLRREISGNQILKKANLNTPSILRVANAANDPNIYILIFERLYPQININDIFKDHDSLTTHYQVIADLIRTIANEHKLGIFSYDLHPNNFIYHNNNIYLLDTADIQQSKTGAPLNQHTSFKKLAILLAQIAPYNESLVEEIYQLYTEFRHWDVNIINQQSILKQYKLYCAHNERKLLRKIHRSSTHYICKKNFYHTMICKRKFYHKYLQQLLLNPDKYIEQGQILKAGNTCTVAQIKLHDLNLVIKRYNIKNFWHKIKRACQRSRAAICWQNAHRLLFYNIQTPNPIAILENRHGIFRGKSYYIAEYIDGISAQDFLTTEKQTNKLQLFANKLLATIHKLNKLLIRHGDMKANNFLLHNNEIFLLDLDSIRKMSRCKYTLTRSWQKDLRRFWRNLEHLPQIKQLFLAEMRKINGSQ